MAYSKTNWQVGDTITAAKMNKIEQGVYDAHNGSGSGGGITTETDPTVPSWAKQSSKPTYTASEVGALPSSTEIHNVPSGGTTGQVLTKRSSTNYDLQWSTPSSGSGSGSSSNILILTESNSALSQTVQQISDAILGGTPVYLSTRYGTSSSYIDHQTLAPVIYVYRYGSNIYRVVVSSAQAAGDLGSKSYIFTPRLLIYQASSTSAYPTYYASIYPVNNTFTAS